MRRRKREGKREGREEGRNILADYTAYEGDNV
jgi:hypothetical protein